MISSGRKNFAMAQAEIGIDSVAQNWLAVIAHFEARGEGEKGMINVIHVIINRYVEHNGAASIEQIVRCKYQFSCLKGEVQKRELEAICKDKSLLCAAKKSVKAALSYPDTVGGANHYHGKRISPPAWADPSDRIPGDFGTHLFYRTKFKSPFPKNLEDLSLIHI
eukprot:TRINITY_DN15757_c0_g1_i1.p1 TRINITY_DN15757_c0_g1~~TRINITY_DN15757_c0_g1_i1.p1  ORF type:complete len:165 (-),score=18.13 TRINITY_DN15757_c0_g1_i1:37-531(-)